MCGKGRGMCVDLLLRCAIIAAAASLACAWMQAFCEPWPLVDAFVLAPTAEVQVVRSLGVSPQLLIRTRRALRWFARGGLIAFVFGGAVSSRQRHPLLSHFKTSQSVIPSYNK